MPTVLVVNLVYLVDLSLVVVSLEMKISSQVLQRGCVLSPLANQSNLLNPAQCLMLEDTIKNGNNNFLGLNMMNILKVHFAESVRNTETPLSELGVHGSQNLSQIGGRQLRR